MLFYTALPPALYRSYNELQCSSDRAPSAETNSRRAAAVQLTLAAGEAEDHLQDDSGYI